VSATQAKAIAEFIQNLKVARCCYSKSHVTTERNHKATSTTSVGNPVKYGRVPIVRIVNNGEKADAVLAGVGEV